MRKKIVAGNWKMNMTPTQAIDLIHQLKPLVINDQVEVIYCVPYVSLMLAKEALKDTGVLLGAQNMYYEDKGAYTGEISAAMLKDIGVEYVILGHSERRQYFHETDDIVNKKIHKAFQYGITPILCCGETLQQREEGITIDFIKTQVFNGFKDVDAELAKTAIVAYEPIWAIGTGKVASSLQAEEVCASIRADLKELYDEETAEQIRILYGGSVSSENASELFRQTNIDGGLVGGVSLKPEFGKVVNYI